MSQEFHVHIHHGDRILEHLLNRVLAKLDHILELETQLMATQAELAAKLNDVTTRLNKIGAETTTLLAKIDALQKVIDNAPVSPELQKAFDDVATAAGVVDDLVPDQPVGP